MLFLTVKTRSGAHDKSHESGDPCLIKIKAVGMPTVVIWQLLQLVKHLSLFPGTFVCKRCEEKIILPLFLTDTVIVTRVTILVGVVILESGNYCFFD